MELLVKLGGWYCWGFVVFHLLFWRLFDWPGDLRSLSVLNRAIIQVLNVSLIVVFAIFGYLALAYTDALLETPLGRAVLSLVAVFWLARAVQQVIFFKLHHWASVVFLAVFLCGALLFGVPAYVTMR